MMDRELWQRGFAALVEALGRDAAIRFLTSLDLSNLVSEGGGSTTPKAVESRSPVERITGQPPSFDAERPTGKPPAEYHTQLPLFDGDAQPWTAPAAKQPPVILDLERQRLLSALADSQLGTSSLKVAHILQHYPETRDSDKALAIRYWTTFEPAKLEDHPEALDVLYDLQSMATIVRHRAHLQNTLGLFEGHAKTRAQREEFQRELHEFIAQTRTDDPEIRFYLDETGDDPTNRFTGVAGICVLDWRQYEMFHAALQNWRRNAKFPDTIHFADMDSRSRPVALRLLAELQSRRGGLLFVGHAVMSRGRTHESLVSLFIQLVVDAVDHLRVHGCLDVPKAVTVFKEAADGFDNIHLDGLRQLLADQLTRKFPDVAYLRDVVPCRKGREVLLECADLIAAGMQRRAVSGRRAPKDKIAEAVMNVTGFAETDEPGTVFRLYQPPGTIR